MDLKSGPEGSGPPAQSQSNPASKSNARGPPVTSLPTSTIQPVSLGPSASSKSNPNPKSSQAHFASHGPEFPGQLPKPNLLLQPVSLQSLLSASSAHSTSTTRPTVPLAHLSVPLVNTASDSQPILVNKTVSAVASPSASLTRTSSSVRPPPALPLSKHPGAHRPKRLPSNPHRPTPVP